MNFSDTRTKYSASRLNTLRKATYSGGISDLVWSVALAGIKYQISTQTFFEIHLPIRQQLKDKYDI